MASVLWSYYLLTDNVAIVGHFSFVFVIFFIFLMIILFFLERFEIVNNDMNAYAAIVDRQWWQSSSMSFFERVNVPTRFIHWWCTVCLVQIVAHANYIALLIPYETPPILPWIEAGMMNNSAVERL